MRRSPAARRLVLIVVIAASHFVVTLALGVLAFATQGDLARPASPSLAHRIASGTIDGIEFPIVWAVRTLSPERLSGFWLAAVGNSLLWGTALSRVLR